MGVEELNDIVEVIDDYSDMVTDRLYDCSFILEDILQVHCEIIELHIEELIEQKISNN